MALRIELAWPPRQLSPNGRFHHMEVHRFKKAAKDTAYWLTRAAMGLDKHEWPDEIPVAVIGHPVEGKVAPDADNLLASMKAPLDGIALALGVDDKRFRPTVEIAEPAKGGRVVIRVGDA